MNSGHDGALKEGVGLALDPESYPSDGQSVSKSKQNPSSNSPS